MLLNCAVGKDSRESLGLPLMLLNCEVGEKSTETPMDRKEIRPVHPQRNQP